MRTWFRLLGFLRPHAAAFAGAIVCMVLYAGANGVTLALIAPFMRVLFPGGAATTAAGHGPFDALRRSLEQAVIAFDPLDSLGRICVLFLVVFLVKNLADYLQAFLMVAVEQAAIRDLRSRLYAHLQTLSLGFYHRRRVGALISGVTTDMEYLRQSLSSGLSSLVKDALTLVMAVGLAVSYSPRLALVSLVMMPPLAFGLYVVGRRIRRRSGQAQERMGDLTGILQETFAGARVVKAFGMEGYESGRFDRANQAFYRAFTRLRRVAAAARPLSEYIIVLVAVGLMAFGGREILGRGSLDAGNFIGFIGALLATISPIRSLSEVNANLQQGVAAAARVFALLDTPPDVVDRPGATTLPPFRDRVRYENVTYGYDPDRPVLHGLSLEVRRGEVVALVGPSGAGKSTTLDLLARFDDPQQGRVTLDGLDVRDVTQASLRAQLAIVTQETLLFHDTVRHNIGYGRPGADDAAIRAAARAAHALEFIERLPQGFETVIGDRGTRLSGGERQRIAIARALLRDAPLLLLDEATSSLDTESERMVQEALDRLMRDRTVLVVAHRLSTVQHADRIVVLEDGRIAAIGTHAELLERGGTYRRLYELQFAS